MLATLFFLIQIGGMIMIVLWAHLNDGRSEPAAQRGLLAMAVPKPPKAEKVKERPTLTRMTEKPVARTPERPAAAPLPKAPTAEAPQARPTRSRPRFIKP